MRASGRQSHSHSAWSKQADRDKTSSAAITVWRQAPHGEPRRNPGFSGFVRLSSRIDNPEDFLRIEISTALKRDIRVIPVLLERASMPPSDDLPDELKSLVRQQALEVSHNRFRADSKRLIGAVERASGAVRAKQQCKREKEERLDAEGREERAPRVLEKATWSSRGRTA
jgi:hypothetical protein